MKIIIDKVVKTVKILTEIQVLAAVRKCKKNELKTKLTEHLSLEEVAELFAHHGPMLINLSQLVSSKLKEKCMVYFAQDIEYKEVIVLMEAFIKEHHLDIKISDKTIFNYEKEFKLRNVA